MHLSVVKQFVEPKSEDEVDSQNLPDSFLPISSEYADTLEESMEQLRKGLESGTVLIQFEVGNAQLSNAINTDQ